jgi:hypothetical protein
MHNSRPAQRTVLSDSAVLLLDSRLFPRLAYSVVLLPLQVKRGGPALAHGRPSCCNKRASSARYTTSGEIADDPEILEAVACREGMAWLLIYTLHE